MSWPSRRTLAFNWALLAFVAFAAGYTYFQGDYCFTWVLVTAMGVWAWWLLVAHEIRRQRHLGEEE